MEQLCWLKYLPFVRRCTAKIPNSGVKHFIFTDGVFSYLSKIRRLFIERHGFLVQGFYVLKIPHWFASMHGLEAKLVFVCNVLFSIPKQNLGCHHHFLPFHNFIP